jgi:hypothetical protein
MSLRGLKCGIAVSIFSSVLLLFTGCNTIDDDRIPAMPVSINLGDVGVWNTYGVSGFGIYRIFIKDLSEPSGFHYGQTTYTGFGGVLLIGGMDPYTSDTNVPLAYDLSCPVECKSDVRVYIDDSSLEAVCPVCDSHYDVVMAGGAPISGPALTGKYKYRLQPYSCLSSVGGGYLITR